MVFTRKFSQFVPQPVTSVVGLTTGANSIGPNGGGGGGSGAVTQEIIQANDFQVGEWIRFDVGSNLYVRALATTVQFAEVIGVVILADPTKFTLQQAGYVTIAQAVFPMLTPGEPQFLSDTILGAMTSNDITIDDEVSKPLFIPDSTDGVHSSGWVIPLHRGIITGGGPNTGGGTPTPPTTDTSIVTVSQNGHGLNVGDWVRVETPLVGPAQEHYVRALADTLANAQAVGVVIQVIDANTFRLQFSGYVSGTGPTTFAPFQDQALAALVPKVVYYLSSTVAGQLTSVDPGTIGAISKPLYIPSQTPATVTTEAGYILPQRPLGSPEVDNPVVHTVVEANTFSVGQWVYISGDHGAPPSYALAQADTLAKAQVAGVIIAASPTQFSVQQSGWLAGAVTGAFIDGGGAPTSGVVYYLSLTTAGNLSATVPTAGQVSKPCYVQEDVATFTGEILPQRPLVVASSPSGGSAWQLIATQTINNQTTIDMSTVLSAAGHIYKDVKFVFSDILAQRTAPGAPVYFLQGFWFNIAVGGVIQRVFNTYRPNSYTGTAWGYPVFSAAPVIAGPADYFTWCNTDSKINFELYIPNANGVGTLKQIYPTLYGYTVDAVTMPVGSRTPITRVNYDGAASPGQGGACSSNLGQIDGLYFFLDGTQYAPPGSTFILISGTLSVYGRIV